MIHTMKAFNTVACSLFLSATAMAETDLVKWLKEQTALDAAKVPAGKVLTAEEVDQRAAELWKAYKESLGKTKAKAWLMKNPQAYKPGEKPKVFAASIKHGKFTMPYTIITIGTKQAAGWPMFICMHCGGKFYGKGTVKEHGWDVNSREWKAQMSLTFSQYKPDGLYFIPRMADDNMGRWWHKHNIEIFTKVMAHAKVFNEVDPNRVYMMGISQGGYGSCHLGPYMADQFAAVGPMAGGMMTVTQNLRNLPFRSDIGEKDTAYKRIELAKKLHAKLDEHRKADPQGYLNELNVQMGRGHGINYSLTPSWLVKHTRNPYPEKIVWHCKEKQVLYKDNFYWISLSDVPQKGEFQIEAKIDKAQNRIAISALELQPKPKDAKEQPKQALQSSDLIVHLNDKLLDLSEPVTIQVNGKQLFEGKVERQESTMVKNLIQRMDPNYAFPATVTLKLKK